MSNGFRHACLNSSVQTYNKILNGEKGIPPYEVVQKGLKYQRMGYSDL